MLYKLYFGPIQGSLHKSSIGSFVSSDFYKCTERYYWELINLKSEINVIKRTVKPCYDQEYFCTFVRDKINEKILTIHLMKAKDMPCENL